MDNISIIKDRVDILDAAKIYGLRLGKHGKAICPFHADKNPSMTVKRGKYRCWACGAHGDVIDLVRNLFGISTKDAIAKLNTDFSLGLNLAGGGGEMNASQIKRQDAIRAYRRYRTELRAERIRALNAYHRELLKHPGTDEILHEIEDELDELLAEARR